MRIIRRKISVKKMINIVLIVGMFVVMFSQTAFAATDMWSKAEEIMKDVYTHILAISTAAGVVTAAIALLPVSAPSCPPTTRRSW